MSYHPQNTFNDAVAQEVTNLRTDLQNLRDDVRVIREQMDDLRGAVRDVSSVAHGAKEDVNLLAGLLSNFANDIGTELVGSVNANFQSNYETFQRIEEYLDDIDTRLLELEDPEDSSADEDTTEYLFDIETSDATGEPTITIDIIDDDGSRKQFEIGGSVFADPLISEAHSTDALEAWLTEIGELFDEDEDEQDAVAVFDKLNSGNMIELPQSPQPSESRKEEINRIRSVLAEICTTAYADMEVLSEQAFFPLLEVAHGNEISYADAALIPGNEPGPDNKGSQLAMEWWFDRVSKVDLDETSEAEFCDFICAASILLKVYDWA